MLGRNTDGYKAFKIVYERVVAEAEKEFQAKIGSLTVFHKILIDRVADAYVAVLQSSEVDNLGGSGKDVASDNLTKWLRVALGELHSSATESQKMLIFYDRVVELANKTVADVHSRRELLVGLRLLVEGRG